MKRIVQMLALSSLFLGTGCSLIEGLLAPADDPSLTADADKLLRDGLFPTALSAYEDLSEEHPDSVYVAMGHAYVLLLAGDYPGADAELAGVEDKAGDLLPTLNLRRAIVALRAGEHDSVKKYAKASGLASGKVLAGEVHLVDTETDIATQLFEEASAEEGVIGATADKYLELLGGGDTQSELAVNYAYWALGLHENAVDGIEQIAKDLPESEDRASELLMWAGRAATSNRPQIGFGLLDSLGIVPKEQVWRVNATRAILLVKTGNDEEAIEIFKQLAKAKTVPKDGLADAVATAASVATSRKTAKVLAQTIKSHAAARGLLEARADAAARVAAPDGYLAQYLEAK